MISPCYEKTAAFAGNWTLTAEMKVNNLNHWIKSNKFFGEGGCWLLLGFLAHANLLLPSAWSLLHHYLLKWFEQIRLIAVKQSHPLMCACMHNISYHNTHIEKGLRRSILSLCCYLHYCLQLAACLFHRGINHLLSNTDMVLTFLMFLQPPRAALWDHMSDCLLFSSCIYFLFNGPQ